MRPIIRTLFFSYLATYFISAHFTGIAFSGDSGKMLFLLSLGLGLIHLITKPLSRLTSLPSEGVGYLFLSFFVSIGSLFILDRGLPGFSLGPGSFYGLNILGFMLNSSNLTEFWSFCFVALIFTIAVAALDWMVGKKTR